MIEPYNMAAPHLPLCPSRPSQSPPPPHPPAPSPCPRSPSARQPAATTAVSAPRRSARLVRLHSRIRVRTRRDAAPAHLAEDSLLCRARQHFRWPCGAGPRRFGRIRWNSPCRGVKSVSSVGLSVGGGAFGSGRPEMAPGMVLGFGFGLLA